ncbi:hypothetical protein LH51_10170 [Nitrincola sp. A-D6]|uniref:hypothetical protein n=1 Tax=Nitrincola sp. A-D6 TaxID=1545442 RepID=UPI00051FD536|nr:hypothetical protein [Nitrincola sp. A-D6]KGK42054.1 hypothetical protein LH51_10170 [Nitrincola sp. A-D6]
MANENTTPTARAMQVHHSTGDNIGGDKHVHQSIAPSAIQRPVEDILTNLRHRTVDTAKEKLSSLQATSQLDTATITILSTVSVLIDLAYGTPPEDSYSIVESCLRSSPDSFFNDIALSSLMRLDIHNKKLEDATRRYTAIKSPGDYCQEVFFEFIASNVFLEDYFSSSALIFSEITLCGITRGLLRCGSFEQSVAAANRLKSTYPTFNSKVVSLITRHHYFNSQIFQAHYWLITRSDQKQLIALMDETITMLEESQGDNKRLIILLISFLNYLNESHPRLIDACWKYINTIEQLDSSAAAFLRSLKERNSNYPSGPFSEIDKAQRDFSYRNSLIKHLTESSEISQEQLFILSHIAKPDDITQWLRQGGKVNTASDLEQQFVAIELLCHKYDGNLKSRAEIKSAVANFISVHQGELSQLNPPRLLELTTKLSDADLDSQVCSLLKPILPAGDLWLSPLVRSYIIALVNSHQLTTLETVLAEIPKGDWCEFLWEVKARQLDRINETSGAIEAMESALDLAPASLSLWHYCIYLHKKNKTPQEQYVDLLKKNS